MKYHIICALFMASLAFAGNSQDTGIDTIRTYIGTTKQIATQFTVLKSTQVREGIYTSYHPNQQIAHQGQYSAGKQSGLWKSFHTNGKIWKEVNYANDLENGISKEWDDLGVLLRESQFKDGEPEGTQKTYDANGRPLSEENWKNGKFHGAFRLWENGILVRELFYEEGRLHGLIKSWYPNGSIKAEMQFVKGLPNGWVKNWTAEGLLLAEGEFKNGDRHGIQRRYENGKIIEDQIWDNNTCVKGCTPADTAK